MGRGMKNKKKENSIRNLINLYTVVMGVALSLGITNVIDPLRGLHSVTITSFMLFSAFLVTLVPFYHGALRHLDDVYIENENDHIRDLAFVLDFMLLLLHGIAFVILSLLIQVPNHFAWALIGLLLIDVIWGVFVHFASSTKDNYIAEWKWSVINLIFILLSAWYLIGNDIFLEDIVEPHKLATPILIICLVRTLIDYAWAKEFYFPK
jgi:hypothetical protein